MKRSRPGNHDDSLFDLPLDARTENSGSSGKVVADARVQSELPLGPADSFTPDPPGAPPATAAGAGDGTDGSNSPGDLIRPAPGLPSLAQRIAGGALDMVAHVAVLGLAVAGSWWLGVPPVRLTLLPLVLFIAGFSFIYHVLPLVFWGHTPGMARLGLVARSLDGGPLTIGQAVRRWIGAIMSIATLGLFLLLGTERTLADRLSGSTVLGGHNT